MAALHHRACQYTVQTLLLAKCMCRPRRGTLGPLTDLHAGRNLLDSDTAAGSAPRDSSRSTSSSVYKLGEVQVDNVGPGTPSMPPTHEGDGRSVQRPVWCDAQVTSVLLFGRLGVGRWGFPRGTRMKQCKGGGARDGEVP